MEDENKETPANPTDLATEHRSHSHGGLDQEMEAVTNRTDAVKEKRQNAQGEPEVTLEDEDYRFMAISAKEKAAWIKMIKSRHAGLVKREQEHKKWQDTMIQRRLDVYSRSKKLLNAQRDGFRFLFKMTEVVKNLAENKAKENETQQGT